MRYKNFKDPLGLIRRMLKSGDPGARMALIRAAARIFATPVDLILAIPERRLVSRSLLVSETPIVLVVGAPRGGTTLVSQVLSRQLDVSTITNVVEVFPRSPIVASRLLRAMGSYNPKGPLRAFYGNTAPLRGLNDAFEIWNRWLGPDRYQPVNQLTSDVIDEMRAFFSAWASVSGRPILNKNNRNTAVMGLLAGALPNAHFVLVERDPLYVAQSLLIAREVVQGDRREGWGLGVHVARDDPIDSVAEQVADVARISARETGKVGSDRLTRVGYEAFCADPGITVASIGDRLNIRYSLVGIPQLEASQTRRLPRDEFQRLEAAVREQVGD